MTRFQVYASERIFYVMEVEAADYAAAKEAGRAAWLRGEYRTCGDDDFTIDDATESEVDDKEKVTTL